MSTITELQLYYTNKNTQEAIDWNIANMLATMIKFPLGTRIESTANHRCFKDIVWGYAICNDSCNSDGPGCDAFNCSIITKYNGQICPTSRHMRFYKEETA